MAMRMKQVHLLVQAFSRDAMQRGKLGIEEYLVAGHHQYGAGDPFYRH